MKQTKFIACIICFFLLLSCCSCGWFGPQEYICKVDDVKSVQIVSLGEYVEDEYRYDYTVLYEIEDCVLFVEELNELKHSVNWGDPMVLNVGYTVIRIEYTNGDFDFIHSSAQLFNRSEKNDSGFFFFDKEQFDALISEYMD